MFKRIKSIADTVFNRVRGVHGASVKVGFIGNHYPDGTSVVSVAYFHEFGTSKMPARPFLRLGVRRFNAEEPALRRRASRAVLFGMPRAQALGLIGAKARDHVVAQINDNTPPALAPATIKAKGSSKTLVDTGLLKQSVTWEINDG